MPGPKYATAFSYAVGLTSQADTDVFVTTPTLAAGDVQVSQDGSQFANIGTLPVVLDLASGGDSGVCHFTLTVGEMTGSLILVLFHDAAGSEWQDLLVVINTETGTVSEVNTDVEALLAGDMLDVVVEPGYTLEDLLKLMAAVLCGKSSGGGTATVTFRSIDDSADRVVATIDTTGNRSAVVLDAT